MLRRFVLYVYLPAEYSFTQQAIPPRQVWDCRCVAGGLRRALGWPSWNTQISDFSFWRWGEIPKFELRSPFGPVLAVPWVVLPLYPPPPYSAIISYRISNFFYLVRSNAMHSSANNSLFSLSTLSLVRWLTLLCLHPWTALLVGNHGSFQRRYAHKMAPHMHEILEVMFCPNIWTCHGKPVAMCEFSGTHWANQIKFWTVTDEMPPVMSMYILAQS